MPRIAADYVDVWLWRNRPAAPPEFLLLQRAPHRPLPGLWLPVMGRIEPGETAVAAALRETREETGLIPGELYQLDNVHVFFMAATDTVQMTPVFAAPVPEGAEIVLSAEHTAARWEPYPAVLNVLVWPGQRDCAARVAADLAADAPAKPLLRVPV